MIALERVSRWYGQIIGVNDVSCEIPAGLTALLGPNGAGKSTLMKLVTGQLRPTTGRLSVLGMPPFANIAVYRQLGYCPEVDSFYEEMTGREFVTLLAAMGGVPRVKLRSRVSEVIERVGMSGACDRKIGGYSKGMRQRIKIAQGIVHNPKVFILDEPLNGLDPPGRHEMSALLRQLGSEGRCLLVSSHILYEVEQLTHNILLMDHGRLLAQGDIYQIRGLIDQHPHRISLRAKRPRALARRLLEFPGVVTIHFDGEDPARLEVETRAPDQFYAQLPALVLEDGYEVTSMEFPDNNLEAVFRYLVRQWRLLLFRAALRDQMRIGRLLAAALLAALPPLGVALWRLLRPADFDPTTAYNTLSGGLIFGFTLVILSVIFATSAVSQDVEGRTIVYLLTRPVPRWRILLAKFLASMLVIVLTVWLSSGLLALVAFGPSRLGEARLLRDLAILPIGALAYGSLFVFLATFIRWALLLGLLFAFGWESWVPSLPGDFAKISLMAYLRVLAPHPQPQAEPRGIQLLLSAVNPPTISSPLAWAVLGCVIFATLAGAIVIFSEREYAPREDAE